MSPLVYISLIKIKVISEYIIHKLSVKKAAKVKFIKVLHFLFLSVMKDIFHILSFRLSESRDQFFINSASVTCDAISTSNSNIIFIYDSTFISLFNCIIQHGQLNALKFSYI